MAPFLKTIEQRKQFYTDMYRIGLRNYNQFPNYLTGFCMLLRDVLFLTLDVNAEDALTMIKDLETYFPELYIYKPIECFSGVYWFAPSNEAWLQHRLPILHNLSINGI